MKYRLLVAAAAAGLAVSAVVAAPVPAVAVTPSPVPTSTDWLSCPSGQTTGSITSATVTSSLGDTAQIDIVARITPCQLPGPGSVFVVGRYLPAADGAPASVSTRVVAYRASTAASGYRITVPVTTQHTAICVASGPDTRLDCVGLSWPAGTAAPVVTGHIPVDDARVLVHITLPGNGEQHPGCPVCWS